MKTQRLSLILSALALVVALTGTAAMATGVIVTSKQIRNGTILSQDIHKEAVQSSDVKDGSVTSADIGNGDVASADIGEGEVHTGDIGANQVTPANVAMPAPAQLVESDVATAPADTTAFSLVDVAGSYTKQDASSVLSVEWTGSVGAGATGACVYQLRVDGQPASGSGQVYVPPSGVLSASASALFSGLGVGPHQVEIWAMIGTNHIGSGFTCTVGPAAAGIGQTFVISEEVI